jgi:HJR/Mrr/RecB family endonuclease
MEKEDRRRQAQNELEEIYARRGNALDAFFKHPQYLETLARMRHRLVYVDEFGDYRFDQWDSARAEFIRTKMQSNFVLRDVFAPEVLERDCLDMEYVISWVDDDLSARIDNWEETHPKADSELHLENCTDPGDFEEGCRHMFELYGFEAIRTGASGDQGADIVAHVDSRHV